MKNLFADISKITLKSVRIELSSSLNQHLIGSTDVILWNQDIQHIDDELYEKFRLAIKPKACRFYTLNKLMPFHDFCIALLCSVDYGLNHTTAPDVKDKTFISAWRTMTNMKDTADQDVRNWLNERIGDRNPEGYCNTLGITRQNAPISRRRSDVTQSTKFRRDADKLSKACLSGQVKDIGEQTPITLRPILFGSTATPEGQLDGLRIAHMLLLNKNL